MALKLIPIRTHITISDDSKDVVLSIVKNGTSNMQSLSCRFTQNAVKKLGFNRVQFGNDLENPNEIRLYFLENPKGHRLHFKTNNPAPNARCGFSRALTAFKDIKPDDWKFFPGEYDLVKDKYGYYISIRTK